MNPRRAMLARAARVVAGFSCVLLILAMLAGCVSVQETGLHRYSYSQPHMGTLFTITLFATDESVARSASDAAFARVAGLDRALSDYDPESELMRLCRRPAGEPVRVSEDLFEVLQEAQRISGQSGGAFDVTIGPLVRQWRRARRTETLPTDEQIALARASTGWQKLKLDVRSRTVTLLSPGMQLDLGGIAKGFAADKALATLRSNGVTRALVAASGDIAIGDAPPGERGWRVDVGSPKTTNAVSRTLVLKNAAISTSGDEQQFAVIGGIRYSHIVDPRTGLGLTDRVQVSVVAQRAVDTDALATALCVLGRERGRELLRLNPQVKAFFQLPSDVRED